MKRACDAVAIEPLEARDLESARAIYNHYVLHSTATFDVDPLGAQAFAALLAFSDPRHAAFAVRRAQQTVGYCYVGPYKARCAYGDAAEVTVYLAPEATGGGLGRLAVEHLERHARGAGLHVLIAGICTENDGSLRLFERCGFEHCAHFREVGHKFGRRLDVAYLQKILR